MKLIRSKERQLNSVMEDMATYLQKEEENLQSAVERDLLQMRERKRAQAQNVERAWMRIQGLSRTEKTRLCPICLDENAVREDASLNGFCCFNGHAICHRCVCHLLKCKPVLNLHPRTFEEFRNIAYFSCPICRCDSFVSANGLCTLIKQLVVRT